MCGLEFCLQSKKRDRMAKKETVPKNVPEAPPIGGGTAPHNQERRRGHAD